MADSFLSIEIDRTGVRSAVVRPGLPPRWHREQSDGMNLPDQALSRAVAAQDLTGCRQAVVLIDSAFASFRQITLPFSNRKKLAQVLPFELAAGRPDPEEAFEFAFTPLSHCLKQGETTAFCVCVPTRIIDAVIQTLAPHKIIPSVITVNGYAQAIAFSKIRNVQDAIFIYWTQDTCILTLIRNGQPHQIRSLRPGQQPAQTIARILQGMKMRDSLQNPEGAQPPIFLSAGLSASGLREVHQELKMLLPTEPGKEPLMLISESADLKDFPGDILYSRPPSLLNFARARGKSLALLKASRSDVILAVSLAACAVLLVFFNLHQNIRDLENRIARGNEAMAAVYRETFPDRAGSRIPAPFLMMQAELDRLVKKSVNTGGVQADSGPSVRATDLLSELSGKIPPDMDVELDRLVLTPGQLILSGSTDTFNTVDRLKGLLDTLPAFRKVDLSGAEAGKGTNRIQFKFFVEL